jgi:hypothetical protein
MGTMVQGGQHQTHHLMMVKGEFPLAPATAALSPEMNSQKNSAVQTTGGSLPGCRPGALGGAPFEFGVVVQDFMGLLRRSSRSPSKLRKVTV